MAELSKPGDAAPAPSGVWVAIKKVVSWLLDWFAIQPLAIRLTVLVVAVLIPASGIYSFTLLRQQATLAEEVKIGAEDYGSDAAQPSKRGLALARCGGPSRFWRRRCAGW